MPWIVEPPSVNSVLIDDSCRIVEVDGNGKFIRVIAKLHKDISSDSAAVIAAVVEMYETLKAINEHIDHRTYPGDDNDDEEEEREINDEVLDNIEDEIERIFELIEGLKP